MTDDTWLLRAALLAALNTAGRLPISTDDIAAALPWERKWWRAGEPGPCEWVHPPTAHRRMLTCTPDGHIMEHRRRADQVYPHLRALERQGRVERIRVDGHRRVYWRAVDNSARAEIAELEALWNAVAEP